jgi:cysteine desulfurase
VPGRAAQTALEGARDKLAQLIGARSANQIIFTCNATYAAAWALSLLSGEVVCSPVEHPAVRNAYFETFNPTHYLTVDNNGLISGTHIKYPGPVICIHVQNEIGVIEPIEKIDTPILVSDISQSLGKLPVNVGDFPNLSIAIAGAHKWGGPHLGFLYLKDTDLWKEFGTGSRYFLDQNGSPPVAYAVAAAVALEEALNTLDRRYQNMLAFRDILEPGLEECGFQIIGRDAPRLPGTTFARVPKSRAIQLMNNLAECNIYIGSGSACGSLHTGSSPLMAQLGQGGGPSDFVRISQFGDYGAREAKHLVSIISNMFPKPRAIL